MSITLVIIIILGVGSLGAGLVAYLRREKIKRLETQNEELARGKRLAEADSENLLKYMVDANELKEAQEDDYIEFKAAENKHEIIGDIMERFYSRKLSDD